MPEEITKDPVDRMNAVLIALNISLPNENYAPEVYYPAFLDLLRTAKNNKAANGFQAYLQPNKNALNKVSGTKDLNKFNQFMDAVDITKKDLKEALKDPKNVVEEALNKKKAQAAQSQPPAAENKGFFARVMSFLNSIVLFFRPSNDRKVSPEVGNVTPSERTSVSAKSLNVSTGKKLSNNTAEQAIEEINKANNLDAAISAFDKLL